MSAAHPKARRRFPGLNAAVLQHPYDRAALGALQRVSGLDLVVRKFIELFPERVAYILNTATESKQTGAFVASVEVLYHRYQEASY